MAAVIDRPATVTTNPLFEKNSQRAKLTTGIKKNTDSILLKDNTLININKLGRELFLTFALKRHPPTTLNEYGQMVSSSVHNSDEISKELKNLQIGLHLKLDKKIEEEIVKDTKRRLSLYAEVKAQRSKQHICSSCCCIDTLKTCSLGNAYPRSKLLCSTAMAYFDTISDVLVIIAIYGLLGVTGEDGKVVLVKSRVFCEFFLYPSSLYY